MSKETKKDIQKEMTAEEARAYRASLYKKADKELTEEEKREQFRIFWAKEKNNYPKMKDIEEIIWLHLKAIGLTAPEKFKEGLENFGFKK